MKRTRLLGLCLIIISLSFNNRPLAATLRFVTQDFPPYTYLASGRPAGPMVEVVERVCAELPDQSCEIRLLPWRRALRLVRRGASEGVFVVGWNAERADWMYFSAPLISLEYGLFVRDDNPLRYRRPRDIHGYTVAVFGPSNTSHSLEQLNKAVGTLRIQQSPDDDVGFRQLSAGRVDAVYSNRDVGWAMIRRLELENLRYAGTHRQLTYHVGFSKAVTDKRLVQRFDAAYRRLWQRGEIDRLLARYRLSAYSLEPEPDPVLP